MSSTDFSDPTTKASIGACKTAALGFFRSQKSVEALKAIGHEVLRSLPERDRLYCKDPGGLDNWIKLFITELQKQGNFPEIVPWDLRRDGAEYQKTDWTEPWTPRSTGNMKLNRLTVEAMVRARKGTTDLHREAYRRFVFALGFSMACQLAECFFYSLAPTRYKAMIRQNYIDDVWEARAAEHSVEVYMDPENQLRHDQAGVPWLVTARSTTLAVAKKISVLEDPSKYTLPLTTYGQEVDAAELRKRTRMDNVQRSTPKANTAVPATAAQGHVAQATPQPHAAAITRTATLNGQNRAAAAATAAAGGGAAKQVQTPPGPVQQRGPAGPTTATTTTTTTARTVAAGPPQTSVTKPPGHTAARQPRGY